VEQLLLSGFAVLIVVVIIADTISQYARNLFEGIAS